jgi:hypothetical protein
MGVKPMQVEIHIEELVLHGVDVHDRHAVAEALQRELSTLVAGEGVGTLLASPERFERWRPSSITLEPGMRPERLGASLAQTLHKDWK